MVKVFSRDKSFLGIALPRVKKKVFVIEKFNPKVMSCLGVKGVF